MKIPFEYGEIVGQTQFINRDDDRARLALNLTGGLNTMLISPRRWGKSSLVQQVAIQNQNEQIIFCFIDLFHIRDEQEFYAVLTKTVIEATSNKMEEWLSTASMFLKRLSPKIGLRIDPVNEMEISFEYDSIEKNYRDILDLAEKVAIQKNIRIVICVDEFQSLMRFNEPLLFQQRLRASWQHHKNVSYCLYGSKKHMMIDIFQNKSMPFYKFGDVMFLKKIATKHWLTYITKQFKSTDKSISKELALSIVAAVKNHSYYVQQLSHLVWVRTESKASKAILKDAINDLLNQNSILFNKEIDGLSNPQISFLKALTNGETQFHATKVMAKYKLGSSSAVSTIKKALEKKEVIDTLTPKLEFIDPVFEWWFKERYLK